MIRAASEADRGRREELIAGARIGAEVAKSREQARQKSQQPKTGEK
jgi:hypothetical protein